jgi:hypothetical protein
MPEELTPQPPLSREAREERNALEQLSRLRKRVPRFAGIQQNADGTWLVQIRNNRCWRAIGGNPFPSCAEAWKAYLVARPRKRSDHSETAAEVNALMHASELVPVVFSVSQSLWRSSMDPHLNDFSFSESRKRWRKR